MKINKKYLYWCVAIVIVAMTAFVFLPYFLQKDRNKFATSDIEEYTVIVLEDAQNRVELRKTKNETWLVNDDFEADPSLMNALLLVLSGMQVNMPADGNDKLKAGLDNIQNPCEITLYRNRRVLFIPFLQKYKSILVGNAVENRQDVYMMLNDASTIYAVYLPGYTNIWKNYFKPNADHFRSHEVFNISADQIRNIYVEWPMDTVQSYEIAVAKNGISFSYENKNHPFDTLHMTDYLTAFLQLDLDAYCNGILSDIDRANIHQQPPFFSMELTTVSGEKKTLKTYFKTLTSEDGFRVDPNRMLALVNNGKDTVVLQYAVFDHIIKQREYFVK